MEPKIKDLGLKIKDLGPKIKDLGLDLGPRIKDLGPKNFGPQMVSDVGFQAIGFRT